MKGLTWGLVPFLGLIVGCQRMHSVPGNVTPPASEATLVSYEGDSSSALVFDPPLVAQLPPLNLSRYGRGPSAFLGYEDLTTNFIYMRTDDRQTNDGTGYYLRQTYIEKVGVSYR